MSNRDTILVWAAWARRGGDVTAAALFYRIFAQLTDADRLNWWESQHPLNVSFACTLRAAIDAAALPAPREPAAPVPTPDGAA